MRSAVAALFLTAATAAPSQEARAPSIAAVEKLKADIDQIRGIVVVAGGIDTNASLKMLAESIIAIDARLAEIERKIK